jgi:4'-phosphopantetheinyl transferase
MRISCWQDPPQSLFLAAKQLHLWRVALQVSAATQRRLAGFLSADEQARAERLRDRNRAAEFVVARGRLRQILGKYLSIQPTELVFAYGPAGKPELHGDFAAVLNFNLAHSGGWALLAVAAGTAVGVDLERIDPHIDCRAIAAGFFDADERNLCAGFSEARQRRGFYRLWTGKEAALKRSGHGFAAEPAAPPLPSAGRNRFFPIGKNYLGALCADTEIDCIQRYQLSESGASLSPQPKERLC